VRRPTALIRPSTVNCQPSTRSFYRAQLRRGEEEDAAPAALELQPGERRARIGIDERLFRVTDFDDQYSVLAQMRRRSAQYSVHDFEPVAPAMQPQAGLASIFERQARELFVADVGRIGHDHVVSLAPQSVEHIGTKRAHTFLNPMTRDIDLGYCERVARDIRSINTRFRQRERTCNGDAARARSDVEHSADAPGIDPRLEARFDELCDRRARHEHALIDVELVPGEPHPPSEIGSGHAFPDTALEQLGHARLPIRLQDRVVHRARFLMAKPGAEEHELGRFVERVVAAVTKPKLRVFEGFRAALYELLDGQG